MSWVSGAMNNPGFLSAAAQVGGGALQAAGTMRGARTDAAALEDQARTANQQSYADEEAQRRTNAFAVGDQAAAFAQAGAGVGGTVAGVMQNSAANAEMDALNIRYRGLTRAYSLRSQARATLKEAPYTAGAQLLAAGAKSYGTTKTLAN